MITKYCDCCNYMRIIKGITLVDGKRKKMINKDKSSVYIYCTKYNRIEVFDHECDLE
jgi:hypothetical protein